jgi:hypothetical protein
MHNDVKLRAEFIMSAPGKPEVDTSFRGSRVYSIRLFVENAPEDVYAVTYELHKSYYDRMRDVRKGPSFEERVTSYGDFEIRAHVRGKTGARLVIENLAQALRDSHASSDSPAVQRALRDIAAN